MQVCTDPVGISGAKPMCYFRIPAIYITNFSAIGSVVFEWGGNRHSY